MDLNDGLFSHIPREAQNNLTQINNEYEKQIVAAKQELAEAEKVYIYNLK